MFDREPPLAYDELTNPEPASQREENELSLQI
jgi:hypothetical protein